jgi:hypothetical protein
VSWAAIVAVLVARHAGTFFVVLLRTAPGPTPADRLRSVGPGTQERDYFTLIWTFHGHGRFAAL